MIKTLLAFKIKSNDAHFQASQNSFFVEEDRKLGFFPLLSVIMSFIMAFDNRNPSNK